MVEIPKGYERAMTLEVGDEVFGVLDSTERNDVNERFITGKVLEVIGYRAEIDVMINGSRSDYNWHVENTGSGWGADRSFGELYKKVNGKGRHHKPKRVKITYNL